MDRVRIRDAETVALLRQRSKQTGKSMKAVVKAALNQYRAVPPATAQMLVVPIARSHQLLAEQQRLLKPRNEQTALDEMHDEDGLPR